jgi:hypothetical protein
LGLIIAGEQKKLCMISFGVILFPQDLSNLLYLMIIMEAVMKIVCEDVGQ